MEWISVNDKLPDESAAPLWIYVNGRASVGRYEGRWGWYDLVEEITIDANRFPVTHWMPLSEPEPPQEVK